MATVSGVWKWLFYDLDAGDFSGSENVSFTSNNEEFDSIGWNPMDYNLQYWNGSSSVMAMNNTVWANEGYETIDFGETEQTVSDEFYEFLTLNAEQKLSPFEIIITDKEGVELETGGAHVSKNIRVTPDPTSQTNLTAENIKEGVSILGVTGTLSAEPGADGKTPVLTQSTINFIPSTTQNGQFTIGAEVEVGDPIIIACTGSGTYEGRTWMVVGTVMSFASTAHVAVVNITGVTETTGEQGPQGETGATGATGQTGPAGQGVPSGGTTGQVLKKASNSNYDTVWADESGGGGETVIDLGSLTIDGEGGFAGTISQSVYNSITPGSKAKFSAMGLFEGYGIVSAMGDPATYYSDLTVYYNGRVLNYSIEITSSLSVHVYNRELIQSYVPDTAGDFTSVSNIVKTTADSPDASSLPEGTLVIKVAS